MADQRAAGWTLDGSGEELLTGDNDNRPQTPADAYVVKDIDQVKQSLIEGHRHVGESQECVALVKHAVSVGPTWKWQQGDRINGYNDPPLEPGTAIATFHKGRYESKSTGNHAAIFLGYGENAKGEKGIRILDQFKPNPEDDGKPKERFFRFNPGGQVTTRYATNYSVIRKP
jgi:hypothetical protein